VNLITVMENEDSAEGFLESPLDQFISWID
jgi:hypothetical protein